MKTKDMIALLQQLDPSGEGYVVVEGSGLRKDNVQVEACYYDGKPVVPLYDEQGEYCGARKMSSGTKLVFSRADTENDFLDRLLERQLEYIYTSDDKQTMGQTYLDTIASRFKWLQLARQEAPNTAPCRLSSESKKDYSARAMKPSKCTWSDGWKQSQPRPPCGKSDVSYLR
jgi:hypothetical protein